MALSREEIQQLGEELGRAISRSSNVDVDAIVTQREKIARKEAATQEDILSAAKKSADEFRKRTVAEEKWIKKNDKYASTTQKIFDDISNKVNPDKTGFEKITERLAGVQELPEHFKAAMAANLGGSVEINNLEDLQKQVDRLSGWQQVPKLFESFAKGEITLHEAMARVDSMNMEFEDTEAILKRFGKLETDRNGRVIDNIQNLEQTNETLSEFDIVADKATQTLHDFGDQVESSKARQEGVKKVAGGLKTAFAGLTAAAKLLLDAFQASAKFGADIDVLGANIRGLQMGEWAETLAESRQAVLALGGGLDEFEGIVSSGAAMSLTAFTGDLGESTKGLAAMTQTSRLLGNAQIDSASFVANQTEVFKHLHNTMAMTISDFTQLNKELVADTDIRNIMMRLSGQERQNKFKQLQQDYLAYRSQGLLHEQAIELAKTMDRMAGKDPRERMKEAARMSAAMTALGMDPRAAGRAQELIVKGGRRTEGENQELAMLTEETNKLVQAQKGQSLQGEIFASALVDRAGIGERLSTTDNLLLAQGNEAKQANLDAMAQRESIANQMLGPLGALTTLLSPTGPIGAAIIAMAVALSPLTVMMLPIAAAVTGVAALLQSLGSVFFGDGSGKNFIYNALVAAFPDLGDIIGGTISTAIEGLTDWDFPWNDDDDEEKKQQEAENAEVMRQIAEEQRKQRELQEKQYQEQRKGNDVMSQGNAINEKNAQRQDTRQRQMAVHEAFPAKSY